MRGRHVRMYECTSTLRASLAAVHTGSCTGWGTACPLPGRPGVQTHLTTYQNKTEARRGGHPRQPDVWPCAPVPAGPCGRSKPTGA